MTRAEKRAYRRQSILQDIARRGLTLSQYAGAYNSGDINRQEGMQRLSASTLYRWQKDYKDGGIEMLAPKYNTPTGARSLDTEDKELIQTYYLDENRPSLAHILRLIKRYHGRAIEYSTARRYINSLPKALVVHKREGAKAYNDKAAPYIKRNYEDLTPMQIVSADHHILDLLCRHPERGTPFRPWLTMITDYRSRKPLGWQVAITPSRYTILSALEQCVVHHGVPAEIHIDNGKDFRSRLLNGGEIKVRNDDPFLEDETVEIQGVFGRLGTTVHFAAPYRAQAKPVERFFRFVAETFSKEFPSYTGSNTSDRPADIALYYKRIKGQEKRGDLLDLDDVAALFDLWVKRFSAEHHHRGDGMHGRTPDQVFSEEIIGARPIMPAQWRQLIFAEQFTRTVLRNGINIDSVNYYAPGVAPYLGHQIIARRPIRDKDSIIVFASDGRQLFTAYAGYMDDTGDAKKNSGLRAEVNKKQKEILSRYREKPTARKSLIDELPEARRAAVGYSDVISISPTKTKKSENISDFFKGM